MGPRVRTRGDTVPPSEMPNGLPGLQWGRAFARAEIWIAILLKAYGIPALQWGRAFARAEIVVTGIRFDAPKCFNGAARSHARR